MRGLIKYIIGATYRPLLIKYLSETRLYSYKGIHLEIPPNVFHPGFFSSTKLLFRYLTKEHLNKKSFLELGAGSGLLSIYAAKRGAQIVASDINPVSIRCIETNAAENSATVRTVLSDLFDALPKQTFDFIVINPPYYKKNPSSISEYAWYCGERGEYFQKLFSGLRNYIHYDSKVLMTLCDGCDLKMIKSYAMENSLTMKCVRSSQTLIEKNFIFKIHPVQ